MCAGCGFHESLNWDHWDPSEHPEAVKDDPGEFEQLADWLTWKNPSEEIEPGKWHLRHRRGGVTLRYCTNPDRTLRCVYAYPSEQWIIDLSHSISAALVKAGIVSANAVPDQRPS